MTTPALRARGLRVEFPGTVALDDVDLDLPRAALTVIVGPNGAGKSTLLEVLAGARIPASGSIELGDQSRAFVPQRAAVGEHLPLTVRDVVTVGAWGRIGPLRRLTREDRKVVDLSMRRLDIAHLGRHPFSSLSGGQRQRALLAQGLARQAEILLLDEPTTGLDSASAELNRTAIEEEIRRGATAVCVSHDERLIAEADQVIRLEAGRLRPAYEPAP